MTYPNGKNGKPEPALGTYSFELRHVENYTFRLNGFEDFFVPNEKDFGNHLERFYYNQETCVKEIHLEELNFLGACPIIKVPSDFPLYNIRKLTTHNVADPYACLLLIIGKKILDDKFTKSSIFTCRGDYHRYPYNYPKLCKHVLDLPIYYYGAGYNVQISLRTWDFLKLPYKSEDHRRIFERTYGLRLPGTSRRLNEFLAQLLLNADKVEGYSRFQGLNHMYY